MKLTDLALQWYEAAEQQSEESDDEAAGPSPNPPSSLPPATIALSRNNVGGDSASKIRASLDEVRLGTTGSKSQITDTGTGQTTNTGKGDDDVQPFFSL